MCYVKVITITVPKGPSEEIERVILCSNSINGKVCENTQYGTETRRRSPDSGSGSRRLPSFVRSDHLTRYQDTLPTEKRYFKYGVKFPGPSRAPSYHIRRSSDGLHGRQEDGPQSGKPLSPTPVCFQQDQRSSSPSSLVVSEPPNRHSLATMDDQSAAYDGASLLAPHLRRIQFHPGTRFRDSAHGSSNISPGEHTTDFGAKFDRANDIASATEEGQQSIIDEDLDTDQHNPTSAHSDQRADPKYPLNAEETDASVTFADIGDVQGTSDTLEVTLEMPVLGSASELKARGSSTREEEQDTETRELLFARDHLDSSADEANWSDAVTSTWTSWGTENHGNLTSVTSAVSAKNQENSETGIFGRLPRMSIKSDHYDADIQSIMSLDDDIQSISESIAFENLREAAAREVVKAFSAVPGMSELYEEGLGQMDEATFIENHRRLLKLFYLNALPDATNASQNLVLRFLRSRVARIRISARLINDNDVCGNDDEQSRWQLERHLKQVEKADAIARWLQNRNDDVPLDEDDLEDSDHSMEEDNDLKYADLAALQKAANHLIDSKSFRVYKNNVRRFVQGSPQAPTSFRAAIEANDSISAKTLLCEEAEAVTQPKFEYEWIAKELSVKGQGLDSVVRLAMEKRWGASTSESEALPGIKELVDDRHSSTSIPLGVGDYGLPVSMYLQSLAGELEAKLLEVQSVAARVLAKRLRNIEPNQIIVSKDKRSSLWNRAQIMLERAIGLPLDWQPLASPQRLPPTGLSRVIWICNCGTRQSTDVPDLVAQSLHDFCVKQTPLIHYGKSGSYEQRRRRDLESRLLRTSFFIGLVLVSVILEHYRWLPSRAVGIMLCESGLILLVKGFLQSISRTSGFLRVAYVLGLGAVLWSTFVSYMFYARVSASNDFLSLSFHSVVAAATGVLISAAEKRSERHSSDSNCIHDPWSVAANARLRDYTTRTLGAVELTLSNLLESIGTRFWVDIPEWVVEPSRCKSPRLSGISKLADVALLSNNTTTSSAQQVAGLSTAQSVPTGSTQSSANTQTAAGLQTPVANGPDHGVPVHALHLQGNRRPLPSIQAQRHVFVTSKVGGHHLLSQWDTVRLRQNDELFFRELRARYISLRGFWRYHFGLKRFSHCDFHRLKKLGKLTFVLSAKELPGDLNKPAHKAYHYSPRPAEPNPPIDAQEFYIYFHACHHRRAEHTFRWHRCRHTPTTSNKAIQSIPRRETALDVNIDHSEIFWGLHVKEKFSIFAIVVYNLIAMTPSLAFFFWWIIGSKEKDLSNGSVPATLTLAGLSLFWAIIVSMKEQEF